MAVDRTKDLEKQVATKMSELETIKAIAIKENRSMTDAEMGKFSTLMTETNSLAGELELEKREGLLRERLDASQNVPTRQAVIGLDERQMKYPGLPSKENRFDNLGEQLQAMATASRPGGLTDRRLYRATGMSEGSPSDGGLKVLN